MSWLSKLLGYGPRQEREGISLSHKVPAWEVNDIKNLAVFLRSLKELFPADPILYLERTLLRMRCSYFLIHEQRRIRIK